MSSADGVWQAGDCGRSYVGVFDRPARSRTGRCRSRAGCQGCRARGAAAPVDGGAPAGGPAAVHRAGPAGTGDVEPATAPRPVAGVPGHAFDAAALAPGGGRPPLDLSADRPSRTCSGGRGGRGGGADGAREPALGVPEDRGGVPQAGCAGVGDLGAPDPASAPGWVRRRGVAGRGGRRSCGRRPPACWRAISSPWRRSG